MRTHSIFFKLMHWLVAFTIFTAFILAFSFEDMKFSPEKLQLINYHKWAGFMVILFFIPRIIASFSGYSKIITNTTEDKMAKIVHFLLLLTMITTPILGWLMSSAKGFQVVLFGEFPIPDLIQKNIELGKTLSEAHELSANFLLFLVVSHIVGALVRQFIKKDPIITQMFKK